MRRRARSLTAFVSIALSCRTPPVTTIPPPSVPVGTQPAQIPTGARPIVELDPEAPANGKLEVRRVDAGAAAAKLTVTPLTDAELRRLLARLEPLPAVTAPAPAMRPPSAAPAPATPVAPIALIGLTGRQVPDTAPAPVPVAPTPPPVIEPLAAPEILPSGEVAAVSEIHVRFAEPMVPVAEIGAAKQAPATIAPAIAGDWRWIDTRVARFTATTRLPNASQFTVTVPAGTRGLSGGVLANPTVGTFSTPTILLDHVGFRQTRSDEPLLIGFDQPFDADAVVKLLRVERAGKPVAFELTTLDRAKQVWATDPRFKNDNLAVPPHHLVIAPKTAWPTGTDLRIVLGAGAPSSEGPRRTTKESVGTTFVVRPFAFDGVRCEDSGKPARAGRRCPAKGYFDVAMSNAIPRWRADQVTIDGKIVDKDGGGYSIRVMAPSTVGTKHTVEVAADLTDEFGQTLTGPRTATLTTTPTSHAPYMSGEGGLMILDPRYTIPQWHVEGAAIASMRIQLYRVTPADYFAFKRLEQRYNDLGTPPGKLVYDQVHGVGPRHGVRARVDLRPALTDGIGHVVAMATATPVPGKPISYKKRELAWIQVTKLGVAARFDSERVNAWATQIDSARFLSPIAGAQASLLVEGATGATGSTSNAEGHTILEFPASKTPGTELEERKQRNALLMVSSGADTVFEAIDRHERSVRVNDARWYVTDDRFTYKPGETVYVKGWVRWSHNGVDPDLALPAAGDIVTYTLHDSKDAKLGGGTAKLTPQGGFDLELAIPAHANLGSAHFTFESRGDSRTWPISIEEFRTPTFSVSLEDDVTHGGRLPLIAGEAIEMTASAKYYSGGGLSGARVRWNASLRAASYVPPGWDEFSFSPMSASRSRYRYRGRNGTSSYNSSSLSGASSSSISIGIVAVPDNEPALLQVDSTVVDLDRATIRETSRPILVHPSAYYAGIRQRPGNESELELIVTDIDGRAVSGVPIEVAVEGVDGYAMRDSEEEPKIIDTQHCKLTSAATPVACAWKRREKPADPKAADQKGTPLAYSVVARVADPRGRRNATRFHIPWWVRESHGPDLTVLADKAVYRPGDVAKLEIFSAIVPAQAVISIARQGVVRQQRIQLTQKSTTYELPIVPGFIRNVHVVVDRISRREAVALLPERASSEVELRLDPEHGRLAVATRPLTPTVGPGDQATFEVIVKHRNKPVAGAEVALLAVDEAVLAVSGKQHADPLTPFYFDVEAGTRSWDTLDRVSDAGEHLNNVPGIDRVSLDDPEGQGFGTGSGRGGLRGRTSAVPSVSIGSPANTPTRKDFRATAVWSPKLYTDANGRATVTVKMPDSLTRFRVVALATAETRYFGKAESTIATQRSLNVRATAPRFLSQGDAFSLPVVVQNLETKPRTIDVGVRASNLTSTGPAGKRVTIPAGQRAELRFDFRSQARGRAVIQTVVASGELFDASQIDLPVYVPVTTETFATYGIVDGDQPAFEQLVVPADIVADVGGVETELFASQLSSLTDAFQYLQFYPFECAEQRSARMLATAAMADVLEAFEAPDRPTRKELDVRRARDVRELERDHTDGAWGYFSRTSVDPYVSQQVVAALAASNATGKVIELGATTVAKANLARLAKLEALAAKPAARTAELSSEISLATAELATLAAIDRRPELAKVLAAAKHRPTTNLAMRLHAAATKLGSYPLDAKARLLAFVARQPAATTMRRELLAQLLSASREEAATASITVQYTSRERLLLVSNAKTTALVLDALIREKPEHPLIPKLARGLLDARKHGRWSSTQENLAVLQTMRRYFETYEKTAPSFVGKLWFGTAGYAQQEFAKRDARVAVRMPWTGLSGTTHSLALARTGSGRMFYRVGIAYAPAKPDVPALDAGFVVQRRYAAIANSSDVTRSADGRYKIKLGALVRVTLEVTSTVRRSGVALVDPLPAGFEPVNTRLATSERADSDTSAWDHVNLRDNRSEAFAMDFAEGRRHFAYTVRATTPGTFAAAPAKAEEMYAPETFGRTAGTLVTIE